MNEQYKRLVNAVFPDEDLTALANKTNVDKKDVEHITIEIIVRVFGDGSDLSKETIEHKIKQIVSSDELKGLISRLESKYGISSGTASKVLGEMLPNLFRKVVTLDNSYFESNEVEKHEVQYKALEEVKPVEEIKEEMVKPEPIEVKKEETTVDDVFKNIENNAIKEEKSKYNIEADKKLKKKKSLFAKKDKKEKVKVEEVKEDKREFSIIEKICIIVVLAALAALIGTIVFLIVKQNFM